MRTSLLLALAATLTLPAAAAPALLSQDEKGTASETSRQAEKDEPYEVGQKVDPDTTLPDITGKSHRLGDYEGKPVVIDFWSIQCPWSIKYEKTLLELHARYREKGVVFLAVNANHREVDWDAEEPYARIAKYVKDAKVTYPVLIDEGNVVADRFAARTTPHVFILNEKGVLAYAGGVDDNPKGDPDKETVNYVADALDALLAGKEVAQPTTKSFGCSIKRVKRPDLQ